MATALVDLYGGEDFEPFDRIILTEAYRPSEDEEFMCGKHRAYFLRKLKAWKEAIIEELRATMAQLQVDLLREPDIADRASSETDWESSSAHVTASASSFQRSIAQFVVSTKASMAIAKSRVSRFRLGGSKRVRSQR